MSFQSYKPLNVDSNTQKQISKEKEENRKLATVHSVLSYFSAGRRRSVKMHRDLSPLCPVDKNITLCSLFIRLSMGVWCSGRYGGY